MAEPARKLDPADSGKPRSGGFHSVQGGAKGGGPSSRGKLNVVKTDPVASEPAPQAPAPASDRPNLRVIQGGKSENAPSEESPQAEPAAAPIPEPDASPSSSPRGSVLKDKNGNQAFSSKKDNANAAASLSPKQLNLGNKLASHLSGRKKAIGIGGGAVGILGILISAYISFLPLKLQSMMKNIVRDRVEGTVEHAVERRAEKMFFRYAIDSSEATGRPIVATGSPLLDLYKTWRAGKFEDLLAKKYGITISKAPGGKIRVAGPKGWEPGEFDSPGAMEKYFGDLTHRQFRGFLREATNMTTRRTQILFRRHTRIWMRDAYGFRIGKLFKGEKDQKKADADIKAEKVKAVSGEYRTRLGKSIACALGSLSECPDKTPSDPKNSQASSEGKAAGDAAEGVIVDDIAKTTGKQFVKDLAADMIKLVGKKLIPVIGWIDLGAHIDDFIWNDRADQVVRYIRSAALANYYGVMQVGADQSTSGENTSGAEINTMIRGLSDMEKSCEYQRINDGGPKRGCDPVGNEKKMGFGVGQTISALYRADKTLSGAHPAFAFYLKTPIPTILGWAGGVVNFLISHVPIWGEIYKTETQFVSEQLMKLLAFILDPGCTGAETGSESFTCASGGADVTYNDFADHVLGAPAVSDAKAYQIDTQIAAENDQYESSKGLWNRFASLDYQHSFLSLLIARVPTDPIGSLMDNANSMFASANWFNFTNLFISPFQGKAAYAADPKDAFGVEQHRYTDAQLDQPIDEGALTKAWDKAKADGRNTVAEIKPEDCPDADKQPNMCQLDLAVIQSQMAAFTTADDGGLPREDGGTTAGGAVPPPTGKCQVPAPGSVPNAPVPPNDYTRVQTHGVTLNKRTLAMLTVAEGYYGGTIPLSQGSYNAGGVAASAGTHDGGGALDVSVRNMSQAQILKAVSALRKAGFAAWERTTSDGFSAHHIHAIAIGDKEAAPLAKSQVQDYFDGKSGLASHGADRNASLGRPYPDWAGAYCQ